MMSSLIIDQSSAVTTTMTKRRPTLDPPLDPSLFPTTKYTWEDLKETIDNNNFPIQRSVDQETTYRLYSQKLKREWKSIYDFVLYCKFQYEKRLKPLLNTVSQDSIDEKKPIDGDNSDKNVTLGIDDKIENDKVNLEDEFPTLPRIPSPPRGYVWESFEAQKILNHKVLAMNDFPYYIESGIEHWCVWKLGDEDVSQIDVDWAKEELSKRGNFKQMMYWINPVHLKSLPGIHHAHIVCLVEDNRSKYSL